MENNGLEFFYDVLDESIDLLYENTHDNYFNLILRTINNILDGNVLDDIPESESEKLLNIYGKLENVNFSIEDIRKALQAIVLKGFKEMHISSVQTPDTLGFFVSYLISRLNQCENKDLRILDPVIGTGNLMFSVFNHLQIDTTLFGIDHNQMYINLCSKMSDLLEIPIELYLQDARNLSLSDMDYVIFDTVNEATENNKYFPFELVLKQIDSLRDNGYMIGIVPDDFFKVDKDGSFKKTLLEKMSILSIMELPKDFFISGGKMIVILKKEINSDKKCFMIKLPSFNNTKELSKTLANVETWFDENINKIIK